MSEFRRRLMIATAQGGGGGNIPPITDYVQNGLVLLLDGIEKGNVSGSWIDYVAGHEFVGNGNVQFNNDHIYLEGSTNTYLTNSSLNAYSNSAATIEVVIVCEKASASTSEVVYMPKKGVTYAIGFGFYRTKIIWASYNAYSNPLYVPTSYRGSFSISRANAMQNGVTMQQNGTDYWGTASGMDGYNIVGKRANGSPFKGKIHSIRIYNRQLTQAEVLSNLAVDNGRFNLGLNLA